MLESLSIRNYAIIDEMTVGFPAGFSVITGETGAGKSIIIDAFELVLGSRASTDMVRTGTDAISVSAVFNLNNSPVMSEIPYETDQGILILRRDVKLDGASRCFINDQPVTLKTLKQIGDLLVDLHGQHDHQSLLNVSEHIHFLDRYAGLADLARETAALFNGWVTVQKEIVDVETAIKNSEKDRELYQFQRQEIENAHITHDEDKELETVIQKLSRASELKSLGLVLFQELSESEDSLGDRIGDMASRITHAVKYDPQFQPYLQNLENLAEAVNELAHSFREYAEAIDDDPDTLAKMEERLALIEQLKKKYGPKLEYVFRYLDEIKKETDNAEIYDEKLSRLKTAVREIETKLFEQASRLSPKRAAEASSLSREVEGHLTELGMKDARLVIAIDQIDSSDTIIAGDAMASVGKDGFDRVEFLISTNPGEPPKSLIKIASGGEISRVMLALKLALTHAAYVPVMVFDEIDSGVSGRIAEAVGKKILQLSRTHQVLAITHLPQIAVMADRHFSARKRFEAGRAYTDLVTLDEGERQQEIAAMLSGETLSETALAHAKILMEKVKPSHRLGK